MFLPRRFRLLLTFLVCSASAHADDYQVFILAGQSNASGRANKSALPDDPIDPTILFCYDTDLTANRSSRKKSDGRFEPLRTKGDNFGPEFTLARGLAASGIRENIAIIKVSFGGTSLAREWKKGAGNGDNMYARLMQTVRTATGGLTKDGHFVRVGAFFWMQGESDTGPDAAAYEANLRAFVADVRDDLGAENLPFIIGRIAASGGSASDLAAVQAAQRAVDEADPLVVSFSTDDLPRLADKLQFSGPAQLALGRRFARAYLDLAGSGPRIERQE